MFFFHMFSTQVRMWETFQFQAIHLAFIYTLLGLDRFRAESKVYRRLAVFLITGLAVFSAIYVSTHITELDLEVGFPSTPTLLLGIVLISCTFFMTRWVWGITLPIVFGLFFLYYLFGHHLPQALSHVEYSIGFIISDISVGLSGLFGMFLDISANQIFLFVVFGALLEVAKVNEFFFELGRIPGRFLRGGPGQIAVVSSSLVGSVTGAAVANVAITGVFTIPFMKRMGYKPHQAAAIEATASTGGQIMPPVMGASAFLIAGFLGVPYVDVMVAGIIPAILFYVSVMASVQFLAARQGMPLSRVTVNWRLLLRRGPLFLIPLAVLVYLLMRRSSPAFSAFWAIMVLIGLSYVDPETRSTPFQLLKAISRGALMGARIGISLALIGMVAQTLITTDMGTKLSAVAIALSQGSMLLLLLMAAVLTIFLGCGVPTSAAYTLVAIVVIPSLIAFGIDPLASHFFVFYYAVMSAVTPPVAMAALAAAGLAQSNYMRTAFSALLLAMSGMLLPILFVTHPELLHFTVSSVSSLSSVFGSLILLLASASLFYQAFVIPNDLVDNISLLVLVGLSLLLIFTLDRLVLLTSIAGIGLFGVILISRQLRRT